ncbi:HlyD family type I secretion periplasmic adaptor subunit [Falsihalocynthiibacter sp. SS001]|uniref:HlyD family type I secretion periplasmic adaptor subunit n=1 Tax=Falsihalocynthiibacter sp. SS001 TaxID=3349698 RepID=UPI0036D3F960
MGPTRYTLLGGLTVLMLVFTGFIWGTQTRITSAIIVQGQVEFDEAHQIVQHPTGGKIEHLHIKEGAPVQQGQPLVTLEARTLISERDIVNSRLQVTRTSIARLLAEESGAATINLADDTLAKSTIARIQTQLFETRRIQHAAALQQINKKKQQVKDQLSGIAAQQTSTANQLSLIQKEMKAQTTLRDKGLASAARILSILREEVALQGRLNELIAMEAEANTRLESLELSIETLKIARREEAARQLPDLFQLERKLVEELATLNRNLEELIIRAPTSGTVFALQTPLKNAIINPASPLMYIVGKDAPLSITVRIKPTDIAQVHTGARAVLRLPYFDSPASLSGILSDISPDLMRDKATGQGYYRGSIILSADIVKYISTNGLMRPGMPVQAFLTSSERAPLSFLIQPVADYFNKAMRES